MNRGNHEDVFTATEYGFFDVGQMWAGRLSRASENPWSSFFSDDIGRLFGSMPYCSCIGGKIFVGDFIFISELTY